MAVTTPSRPGILAIWNDCAPGRDGDFEHWFQSEHLAERLGLPGFQRGRRHEAILGSPRYFIFYVTEAADVLTSAAYLERVNNPTPLTVDIMSTAFRNMNRTVCEMVERRGDMRGTFAVTARFTGEQDGKPLSQALATFAPGDAVAGGEIWSAAQSQTAISEEEKLRGGDGKIRHCLLVETLREDSARQIAESMAEQFGHAAEIGIYRLLCDLQRPEA